MPVVPALVGIEFSFGAAMSAKLTAVPVPHGPVLPVVTLLPVLMTKFLMPGPFRKIAMITLPVLVPVVIPYITPVLCFCRIDPKCQEKY